MNKFEAEKGKIRVMEYEQHIKDLLKKEYLNYHHNCGIQVGDYVKVISKCPSNFSGWECVWGSGMDQCVGEAFKVVRDNGSAGFLLDNNYSFPSFCLEKAGDVVINNNLENEVWNLYDESDRFQGQITNYLSFLDVRRQIKKLGLKGYYVQNSYLRFNIGADGTFQSANMADVIPSRFTGGPFPLIDSLLDELVEF